MSTGRLSGRVAVVTGGGQGIGRGIALRYAEEGAKIAVADINIDNAKAVSDEITAAGGTAIAVVNDVASRQSVNDAAQRIASELGPIEILVANAGVTRPAMLWKMTDQQWSDVMDTHLNGSFYWLQAVVDGMRAGKWGRVIFTTSAAGIQGTIGQINYSVAKSGLLGMTRSAARELAGDNIIVNAVAPAAATPMTEKIRTEERFSTKYLAEIPLHRWAEPDEIAGAYVFLASEEVSYMTGQVLSVDGGRVMMR
ncbi:SDR family NAD(P)-dependent oxidoreductase [Blastococcus tunisiensis]|uniref:3-oxoacyl-[acyl-carrier protein] reductase n=1 Tax=Blastococcus tunisiensis TaxID=1798228 RepID=A0A1I1ZV07_9ACTN|nr:3-oxoacyl-ACP reductase FabG [Blastococcus sp. DSM 46838]SFE35208.1 3-oxoacyl-[acyl-carrier protein] reductase [Blastococcus sp. DSM 46838]